MIELAVRVVLSLGVVLGLLWMISRMTSKRLGGRRGGLVQVHARQPLSRGASVNVVTVGDKVLVIGVTENQVNLITELDTETIEQHLAPVVTLVPEDGDPTEPQALPEPSEPTGSPAPTGFAAVLAQVTGGAQAPAGTRTSAPAGTQPNIGQSPALAQGALSGSLLSASTWKQTFAAMSGRTSSGR
jgi:flagellar protein FliO/FliZ